MLSYIAVFGAKCRVLSLASLFLFLSFSPLSQAASRSEAGVYPSANDLLNRLVNAVRSSSYQGRFTYEHSGKLELLEVSHAIINGVEYERVNRLNGERQQLVKSGREASCESLGSIVFKGGSLPLPDGFNTQLNKFYQARVLRSERIAGRETWVLELRPKDQHRHIQVISIDKDGGLPLRVLVVSLKGAVLERLHFVSLDLDKQFSLADFKTDATVNRLDGNNGCQATIVEAQSPWRPAWIPAGFMLSHYHYSEIDGHMETYTDGVASFSIFVSPSAATKDGQALASSVFAVKRGATIIVSSSLNSDVAINVTVLGELPRSALSKILSSVRPQRS